MINKERVALLVEALRDGSWVQGRERLRNGGDEYCCLGVACEVAIANGCVVTVGQHDNGFYVYDGFSDFLPPSVREWYGFVSPDPAVGRLRPIGHQPENSIRLAATKANDLLNKSLAEIGELFEACYINEKPITIIY